MSSLVEILNMIVEGKDLSDKRKLSDEEIELKDATGAIGVKVNLILRDMDGNKKSIEEFTQINVAASNTGTQYGLLDLGFEDDKYFIDDDTALNMNFAENFIEHSKKVNADKSYDLSRHFTKENGFNLTKNSEVSLDGEVIKNFTATALHDAIFGTNPHGKHLKDLGQFITYNEGEKATKDEVIGAYNKNHESTFGIELTLDLTRIS